MALDEDKLEDKVKYIVKFLKEKSDELDKKILAYEKIPSDTSNISSVLKSLKADIINLSLLNMISILWLSDLESYKEERSENIELLNGLVASIIEKNSELESLLRPVQDYFRDLEFLR